MRPPLPTPVRHTTPPAAIDRIESAMTCPTPVHSTMTSGSKPTPATLPEWYVAPRARTSSGFGPGLDPVEDVDLQTALLPERGRRADRSAPRRSRARSAAPRRRAGRPRRPAPSALATTVVGSSSTPRSPSDGSTFIAYSGSMRQRSDMKPSISLMPRSVYWPLRHMSHSPTAQLGQGTGSGRRTMPTTRSPSLSPPVGPGSTTRPRDSWPSTRRVLPRGAQPYLPSAISTSVPQTPTAMASTSTEPSRASGSGTSSSVRSRASSARP